MNTEFYVGEHRGIWVGPVIRNKQTNHPVAFVAAGSEHFSEILSLAPEMLEALRKIRNNSDNGPEVNKIASEILLKATKENG